VALPWVRLDSNIASHDKMLALIHHPSAHRWRAAAVYPFALGWSGAAGTDGHIPFHALGQVHGTKPVAALLVEVGLWVPDPLGWTIPNWAERQQVSGTSDAIRRAKAVGAMKGNCIRWHGKDCGCWDTAATVFPMGARSAK
jgi:hypothetical protein